MQVQETTSNVVIYILTDHPFVYRALERMLFGYQVRLFTYKNSSTNSDCNWMLVVDSYSVKEWLAVAAVYGCRHGRPILILGDELVTIEEELRLVYLGVRGIVPIASLEDDLRIAVGLVIQGHLWLRRATLSLHVMLVGCHGTRKISVREEQILPFLVSGLSNKEIGNMLGISDRTVKFHVSNILRKFKVKNRRALLKPEKPTPEHALSAIA